MRELLRYMQWLPAMLVVPWTTGPAYAAMLGGQESRDPSAIVVHDVHIHEYGVANALRAFAKQQRIVIGYDTIEVGAQKTIQIDDSSSTVAGVLNTIVTQASGYSWKVTDSGAIHVHKINSRVSLVDVQPASFVIADKDRREIWESLESIPELISWLDNHRCTRGELFNGYEWKKNMKKVSLDTGGKTLGNILD